MKFDEKWTTVIGKLLDKNWWEVHKSWWEKQWNGEQRNWVSTIGGVVETSKE